MFLLQIHCSNLTRFVSNCPSAALSSWRFTGKAAFITLKEDVYLCSDLDLLTSLVRKTGVCLRRYDEKVQVEPGDKKQCYCIIGLNGPVNSLFESWVKRSTTVLLTLPMNDHKTGYQALNLVQRGEKALSK